MARIPRNRLTVRALPSGSYQLLGEILGKRIRRRFQTLADLQCEKSELELRVIAASGIRTSRRLTQTPMTEDEQSDVEAALRFAAGRMKILDWLKQTEHLIASDTNITPEAALIAWREALRARRRSEVTITKNLLRVGSFLRHIQVDTLFKISSEMIEKWVYREGAADFTRLTDAQVIKAWLNFCVRRRWLAVSPFAIDTKDLSATARPKGAPRILSPDQCHAYLKAAMAYKGGEMVPYVILTTWCFMRESETRRITKDAIKLDRADPIVIVNTKKRGTPKMRTVSVPGNVLPLLRDAISRWPETKETVDPKTRKPVQVPFTVPFSRHTWTTIREHAGLLRRGKTTRHKRRPILESSWQSDIARHSGFSYFFQRSGDITDTARQAGTSPCVGFRHYLALAEKTDADKFYADLTTPGPERDTPQ